MLVAITRQIDCNLEGIQGWFGWVYNNKQNLDLVKSQWIPRLYYEKFYELILNVKFPTGWDKILGNILFV